MGTIHQETQISTSHSMKSWVNAPYNFFFVVLYAALGLSVAIHPINQQTIEIAAENAAWVGRFVAALFFIMAFLTWRYELRGMWLTIAALPATIWAAYTMTSILGNDRTSWVIAVYVAASIVLLVYCVELRLRMAANDAVQAMMIKETVDLRSELATLRVENEKLKGAKDNDVKPGN